MENSIDSQEKKLAELVNGTRNKIGRSTLDYDEEFSRLARIIAMELMERGELDLSAVDEILHEADINFHIAKVNVAAGQKYASRVLDAWLENPVNSSALKNRNYNCQGVGFVSGGPHGAYWVQIIARK